MSDFISAERKRSWKASHAAAFGSTESYIRSYDEIFGKGCIGCRFSGSVDAALLHLDAITTGANQHRLAQIKQVLMLRECRFCEETIRKALNIVNSGGKDGKAHSETD
jgi:hypothetical protein